MAPRAIILACASLAPAAAVLRGTGQQGLQTEVLTDMRPEVVIGLLSQVEHRWEESFMSVLKGKVNETAAYPAMETSCLKVANSVVAGSEGDEDRVTEYMQDVCTRAKDATDEKMCNKFAAGLEQAMVADSNYNRQELSFSKFCKSFWQVTVQEAAKLKKQKFDDEEAARTKKEEEEKKAKEEKEAAAKKEADEKAAADKKAAEEKAAADQKAAEEKAAADKAAAEEKAAAEKKALEEKTAADKAAAEAKSAADKLAAVKATDVVQNKAVAKMADLTDKMNQLVQKANDTVGDDQEQAHKLMAHARLAMHLAQAPAKKANVTATANATKASNVTKK